MKYGQIKTLSDQQLYGLLQSRHHHAEMRLAIEAELVQRGLPPVPAAVQEEPQEGLGTGYKILLIVLPVLILLNIVIVGLATNMNRRKWNEHWLCTAIGFLAWTVILLLAARFRLV